MGDDIERIAEGVKPPRRDKLSRLADKLDAADKNGGDDWPALFDEYLALATARALRTRPPKVQIKSVAS